MTILSTIAGGLASILSGGTLGVIGAIGNGVLDIMKTKEKNKQELALVTAQKELALANANSATLLETLKLAAASYENDKASYQGAGFVDTVRGLLRPLVTLYLVGIATYLAVWAFGKIGLDPNMAGEITKYCVYTCMDLTALCVSWYFGARQIDKFSRRK